MGLERPQALSQQACRCHLCECLGTGPRALTGISKTSITKEVYRQQKLPHRDKRELHGSFSQIHGLRNHRSLIL